MRTCFYFLKQSYIVNVVGRFNQTAYILAKCYTNKAGCHSPREDGEESKSNRWGYTEQENGFRKHDKNTTGLYHLGTINLPQQLEKNLNEYLKKFPSKPLVEDALQLSKHLQNRGRPTERTWAKYKEAKSTRKKLKERTKTRATEKNNLNEGEESGILSSTTAETQDSGTTSPTKKPKMQEYKITRYKKREAAAYAADRVPAIYGATLRVLHEIAKRDEEFKPETVLDFGSGIGTATWAAHELWKDSIKIYQCVDVSHDMNETAEHLLRNSESYRTPHYIPRVYFKEYLPVTDKVTYDIVLASYSLSEIAFSRARQELLESIWRKTNHFLVIVEKGNNEGFDITTQARNLVAESDKAVNFFSSSESYRDGIPHGFVFSPCPHDLVCPRFDVNTRDHPCNFEQRVQLSFAQWRTSLKKYGYYNEIFSYVVLRKAERSTEALDWPRLLRPVRLREKHVICNFCSKNGALEQKILTKRKHSEIYKCVRHRAKWGDLLPIDVRKNGKDDENRNTAS